MRDNTLPPVGATVTDANGKVYRVGLNALGGRRWTEPHTGGEWVGVGSDLSATLALAWRLTQERDQLKVALGIHKAELDKGDREVVDLKALEFYHEDASNLRALPDIPWRIGGKSGAEHVAAWRNDLANRIERARTAQGGA